jgi:hypothetical protein
VISDVPKPVAPVLGRRFLDHLLYFERLMLVAAGAEGTLKVRFVKSRANDPKQRQ